MTSTSGRELTSTVLYLLNPQVPQVGSLGFLLLLGIRSNVLLKVYPYWLKDVGSWNLVHPKPGSSMEVSTMHSRRASSIDLGRVAKFLRTQKRRVEDKLIDKGYCDKLASIVCSGLHQQWHARVYRVSRALGTAGLTQGYQETPMLDGGEDDV